jgi:catalase
MLLSSTSLTNVWSSQPLCCAGELPFRDAFRFTAADGTSRFGRYRFVPQAGEAFLTSEDVVKRSANFLREELEDRLRTGPAAFRLPLQLAEAGDRTDDVTALWPEGRLAVALGI